MSHIPEPPDWLTKIPKDRVHGPRHLELSATKQRPHPQPPRQRSLISRSLPCPACRGRVGRVCRICMGVGKI